MGLGLVNRAVEGKLGGSDSGEGPARTAGTLVLDCGETAPVVNLLGGCTSTREDFVEDMEVLLLLLGEHLEAGVLDLELLKGKVRKLIEGHSVGEVLLLGFNKGQVLFEHGKSVLMFGG